MTVGYGLPTEAPKRKGEQYFDAQSRKTYIAIKPGKVEYFELSSTIDFENTLLSDDGITLLSDDGQILEK